LINLRNIGQFVIEKKPGEPYSAVYGIEIDQFLKYQYIYQKKVKAMI
jgi:hypothetical protein